MIAITNEEKYLAKIAGEEITTPEPVLRKEQYLSAIANGEGTIPELPITREEQYLAILAGENYAIPTPETRIERYMAKACGLDIDTPTPITNVEYYWAIIAEGGSWQITTLTGTLPLSFLSKGEALANYRLHGTSEEAGVQTENLFDEATAIPEHTITPEGVENPSTYSAYGSTYIPIGNASSIKIEVHNNGYTAEGLHFAIYDSDKIFVRRIGTTSSGNKYSYTPQNGDAYIRPIIVDAPGAMTLAHLKKMQVVVSYDVYLTSYIPHGYQIPLTVTSGEQSDTYPLYIGSTKLGEEEYVDFGKQKVYKRTENLFDKSTAILGKEIQGNSIVDNADWAITPLIPVEPQSYYSTLSFGVARLEYISENDNNPTRTAASSQNPTLSTTHFIRLNLTIRNLTTATIVSGSTPPETYIPYLQPTDPPVPLPAISTYKGENTLSSTETLGEAEITGRIRPIET